MRCSASSTKSCGPTFGVFTTDQSPSACRAFSRPSKITRLVEPVSLASLPKWISSISARKPTSMSLSEIYERLLKDVASVAGYAGEFYTPRHIIAAMIQVVKPRLGIACL